MTKRKNEEKDKNSTTKSERPKTSKGAKQSGAGEPKKKKEASLERTGSQKNKAALSDAQDHKRANIGPSGQGSHRGQERGNKQAKASGRPDVTSVGGSKKRS